MEPTDYHLYLWLITVSIFDPGYHEDIFSEEMAASGTIFTRQGFRWTKTDAEALSNFKQSIPPTMLERINKAIVERPEDVDITVVPVQLPLLLRFMKGHQKLLDNWELLIESGGKQDELELQHD